MPQWTVSSNCERNNPQLADMPIPVCHVIPEELMMFCHRRSNYGILPLSNSSILGERSTLVDGHARLISPYMSVPYMSVFSK